MLGFIKNYENYSTSRVHLITYKNGSDRCIFKSNFLIKGVVFPFVFKLLDFPVSSVAQCQQ